MGEFATQLVALKLRKSYCLLCNYTQFALKGKLLSETSPTFPKQWQGENMKSEESDYLSEVQIRSNEEKTTFLFTAETNSYQSDRS